MNCHFFLCLDNIVLVDAGSYLDKIFFSLQKYILFFKNLKKIYWEIFTFKEIFFLMVEHLERAALKVSFTGSSGPF